MTWNTGTGQHFIASNPASGNITLWGAKTGRYNVKDAANPNGAAKGDGVTDDTAPLQGPAAAITEVFVSGDFEWLSAASGGVGAGGVAVLGPGTFACSGTLTVKADMEYEGANWGATIIDATLPAGTDLFTGFQIKRTAIRNLTIRMNTGRHAIALDGVWNSAWDFLRILGKPAVTGHALFVTASTSWGSYGNSGYQGRVSGFAAGDGVHIDGTASGSCTATPFYHWWVDGCNNGFYIGQYAGTISLFACSPQANLTAGVVMAGYWCQIYSGSIETNGVRGLDITSACIVLSMFGVNFGGAQVHIRNNSADLNMNWIVNAASLSQLYIGGPVTALGGLTTNGDVVGQFGAAMRQNAGSWLLDTGAGGTVAFRTNGDASQKMIVDANGRLSKYNNRTTTGMGVTAISGLDNRSGVTAVDGAPITLFANPVGANQVYQVSAHLNATAFTSGTATYTITWTENGVAKTLAISVTALNTPAFAGPQVIKPDASTNITGQLTGVFTATVTLAAVVQTIVQL